MTVIQIDDRILDPPLIIQNLSVALGHKQVTQAGHLEDRDMEESVGANETFAAFMAGAQNSQQWNHPLHMA